MPADAPLALAPALDLALPPEAVALTPRGPALPPETVAPTPRGPALPPEAVALTAVAPVAPAREPVPLDAPLSPFTRARIERTCAEALRGAGALGTLPTPLEALAPVAGVRERLRVEKLPARDDIRDELRERLLGAVWFEQRALFLDERQSLPRRRFTEAHELVHLLCPWHEAVLRLDTAAELFGELSRGIEAEANFGAGQLIFQGGTFAAAARAHERSLRTPFALAAEYGASRHAAAHHYVESHGEPLALLVAGRWPAADGCLPVFRGVESASFAQRFGRLAPLLGGARLAARPGAGAPLAEAIDAARRCSDPVAAELWLPDRGARLRRLHAEVVNNRHCHLVLVAELPRRPARAASARAAAA